MHENKQVLERMCVLQDRAESSTSTSMPAAAEGKGSCM